MVSISSVVLGQSPWVASDRSGDEARFLFDNQILRYDLATKSWLTAFSLPRSGATAMAADAQGAAVAYGTAVYRYETGFSGEILIGNVSSSVGSLFFDGNLLIAVHSQGLYARVTVFDRTTGAKLSSVETYVDSMHGASHAPLSNRLYGRTQGISPADIVTASYTDAGVVGSASDSPQHGTYPNGTRTWVFPDESRVVDTSGTVYAAPGLTYFGSFAGSVADVAFNGDVPVILRGADLIAFTPNLLEAGRFAVGAATGSKLYVTASEAFVFSPATGNPAVNVVALSAINAPEPGTPVDPNGLAYTVDDAFPDKDGNLLLFSKGQMSLFRWSPTTRQYTGSIPLLGIPDFAAYSAENHSAYFAYASQVVRKLDLSAVKPQETNLFNLPGVPKGFTMAGEFPYVATGTGLMTFSPAGTNITTGGFTYYYGNHNTWDPAKRRVYHFRDGSSPNDLHYDTISVTGQITGGEQSPYHGDFTATKPIRVSPDGSKVVIGSGVVFSAEGLTKVANLANGFSDAVWDGGKLVTLRLVSGLSQLQVWEGDQFLPGSTVRQFSGTPLRILGGPSGLIVVTSVEGTPRFTLLDASFETVFISPTRPLPPSALAVTARTESSVSLQWQDMSDNEDAFRVEYRSGSGTWVAGPAVGAGVTSALVSGLPLGTTHEFRVVAASGALVSTASPTVTAKTLDSPGQPVGEPYNLRVTRIYNNRITLEWQDNAVNETGFRVYRSTTSSSLGTLLSAPAGAVTFTDSGLTANTTYYYRVQAANGTLAGDLSSQINARTLSGAVAPSSPSSLAAAVQGVAVVTLTWNDNSTNEDEFIVERSTSPALVWTEIGRVPFNVRAFSDSNVTPDTSYSYRVSASNSSGVSSPSTVTVTTPKLGGEFSGYSVRSGDTYYFAFSGPSRIERYDLLSRSWLSPITLQATATALWADESGIFVAEDRSVIRFDPDGGSRAAIGNAESSVKGLFTIGDVLIFQTSASYTSLNKHTGIIFATFNYGYGGTGHAVYPSSRKVFYRSSGVSPSDIYFMEIGVDGKLIKGAESPYHGSYPSAIRTFVFPNGTRVADNSGTVYSTDSLVYNNSLGGSFTDLDFHGVDVPIILRGDKLLSYSNTLLESGSFALGSAGLKLAVSGTDAVVFFADGTNSRGLRVQAVSLSEISAPDPGTPIDPRGLEYAPDDVFADKDGNILLLSKSQLSLFKWSPSQLAYLPTLPLAGAPAFAAYSKENHRVYFAYDSQVVRQMNLADAEPKETALFNLPSAPRGFALAGEFPYVAAGSGLMTFSPAGVNLTTGGFTYYSGNHNTWDPVNRRVYHFRDGISPNDLHYDTVSATGQITGGGETPYHGDYSMVKPIRVNPDGSKVVIGSGIVFNAIGLTKIASLANGFTDADWFDGNLVTARLINGVTQLQTWSGTQFVAGLLTRQVSGTPVRLLALDSARLLLITLVNGAPRFTILNTALEVTYISPTKPLPPSLLAVAGRTTNSVTLRWQDDSDNEDGFLIEYRPLSGVWTSGGSAPANATESTVSGLSGATSFEFRVSATLGNLASAPSSTVNALTLSSPAQPVGEPYGLRVSRVFSDSITLEWQDNASNETGFRILRSTTATGATTTSLVPAGATSVAVTGLTAGTAYYFRIQVENGAATGDLSAQVSSTTRSSNSSPTAPNKLAVALKTPASVHLTWSDNSANEETFLIERSSNPASVWIPIGSVPYNTVAFTDGGAAPNTAYSYRVKAVNASGSSGFTTVTTTTPKLGGDFAGFSMNSGDVCYFAFGGPNRIERYDLLSRSWLSPIPLEAAATALWVDESNIYVAEDRAVIRFALDGGGRTPVGNAEATVKSLFTLKDLLVFGANSGDLVTMNKQTGWFLSNIAYSYAGGGFSVAPARNRAFFRSTSVSPSDIHYLEIGTDGKLIVGDDSPYHGAYPSATRTFVFPNGARVADDSGTIYSTDSLSYTNSLGGAFTDIDFHGADIPIVLRGNKLHSYSNALLETGNFTLDTAGLRLAVSGTDAVVFIADGSDSRGLRIQSVPLSLLSAEVPGLPVDPRGIAYTPDEVFVDKNGELLFFSKTHLSLFRWSPRIRDYLPTLPLLGSPRYSAYSKQNHRMYFAYDTQVVREMDLAADSPVETPLFALPSTPRGLATAGEFVFATDASGSWDSHYIFSSAGIRLQAVDWNYYSRVWEWEPVKRRMYFFRDDTSPNDLHFETIDTAGTITGKGETPYHGTFTVTPPIRANADGSRVVIGSGAVFETVGMTRLTTLANTFTDALWRTTELLTIRASGTQTEIQRWDTSSFAAGTAVPPFEGSPLRLLPLNSRESALITLVGGMPRIYLLREDLTISFTYVSGDPSAAIEDEPYAWTPRIQWQTLGNGPLTVTAPVLPQWLTFADGIFSGIPREADSGDQQSQYELHRVVLRAVDAQNKSEEKEFNITVAWRNDAPSFPENVPPVLANDRADKTQLDLGAVLTDPDEKDTHRWEIVAIGNPAMYSELRLDAKGLLEITYAPYFSGSSTVTVKVTDASGSSARTKLEVILPKLPPPKLTVNPAILFNRSNGLYEQIVTVENIAARAIWGFDLTVSGLRAGVSLYNGTPDRRGGSISYREPLLVGQSVTLVIRYYANPRGTIPQPEIVSSVALPGTAPKKQPGTLVSKPNRASSTAAAPLAITPAAPFAISRVSREADGSVLLEFPTESGKNYRMHYSADAIHWNACPDIIVGEGGTTRWFDRGPPTTESPPASEPRRFYRLERPDSSIQSQ